MTTNKISPMLAFSICKVTDQQKKANTCKSLHQIKRNISEFHTQQKKKSSTTSKREDCFQANVSFFLVLVCRYLKQRFNVFNKYSFVDTIKTVKSKLIYVIIIISYMKMENDNNNL